MTNLKNKPKPFSITNWSEDDKPREKLMLKGKGALVLN
jgi:DNA repair protein RadC